MRGCGHRRKRSRRSAAAAASSVALLLTSFLSPALAFDYNEDGMDDGVFDFGWDTSPVNCFDSNLPMCQNNADCTDVENVYGMEPFCGTVECHVPTGTCGFHAWRVRCYESVYVSCVGIDSMCTKGPKALPFSGTCDGWENKECVYRWCPGDCCTQDSDCTADAGRLPLDGCGDVKCNLETNKCEFDAKIETGQCGEDYYVYCGGDDNLCTKGPEGSVGRCTGYGNYECVYSWCPFNDYTPPPSPAPTPVPCCSSDLDCTSYVDPDGRSSPVQCGNVACGSNGMCEFSASVETGDCFDDYYVFCDKNNTSCTKGPVGSEGTCTWWGDRECVYTWCPL